MAELIDPTELFFHQTSQGPFEGPLFSMVGRSTVTRGTPLLSGNGRIYYIPNNRQPDLVTLGQPGRYDDWAGKDLYSLVSKVPDDLQLEAEQWLKNVFFTETRFKDVDLRDIRYLPDEFLIGTYKMIRKAWVDGCLMLRNLEAIDVKKTDFSHEEIVRATQIYAYQQVNSRLQHVIKYIPGPLLKF